MLRMGEDDQNNEIINLTAKTTANMVQFIDTDGSIQQFKNFNDLTESVQISEDHDYQGDTITMGTNFRMNQSPHLGGTDQGANSRFLHQDGSYMTVG